MRLLQTLALLWLCQYTGAQTTVPATPAPTPFVTTVPPAANWSGCVDPDDASAKVTIGKPTTICLQIGNGINWVEGIQYIRLSFQPKGDQYSRLYIPKSYSDLVANATGTIWEGKYLTVGAASQSALSFLRVYSDVTAKKIYPYLTAIISVKRGVVQGITWDEACMFCSPSECEEITYDFNGDLQTLGQPTTGCFVPYQDCKQTICDLTLYVVWTGTDSNNRAFQSSASRFSAFPSQDWKDRVLNNLPDIPIPGVNRQLTAVDVPPLGQDL